MVETGGDSEGEHWSGSSKSEPYNVVEGVD